MVDWRALSCTIGSSRSGSSASGLLTLLASPGRKTTSSVLSIAAAVVPPRPSLGTPWDVTEGDASCIKGSSHTCALESAIGGDGGADDVGDAYVLGMSVGILR